MGVRGFLLLLGRRWRSLVGVFLLGAITSGVLIFLTDSRYESSATLFVSSPPTTGLVNTYAAVKGTHERVVSYTEMATQTAVLAAAAARLGDGTTAEDLEDDVSAEMVTGTLLVTITAEGDSPERAQEVAGVVVEELLAQINAVEEASDDDGTGLPFMTSIASTPSTDDSRVEPDLPIAIGTGAVFSILVALCVAVMRDVLDTTITTADQLREATGHSLVTVVPRDPDAAEVLTARGPAAEAFRVLRTHLQFADIELRRELVLVTSPAHGEGKTFVAVGLAAANAGAGRSVLLVDADLRHPAVADRLDLDSSVGLSSVLVGKTRLEDALVEHASGMTVLPAGPLPPNPAGLLESETMAELLTSLRGQFDLVVVDAPALLPTADASVLVTQADGTLLVVRHGISSREEARLASERVAAVSGQFLGAVLNGSPHAQDAYGYELRPQPTSGSGGRRAASTGGRRARR